MKKIKLLFLTAFAFLCFSATSQTTWTSKDIYQLNETCKTNSAVTITGTNIATSSLQTTQIATLTVIETDLKTIDTDIKTTNTKLAGTLTVTPVAGSVYTTTPAVTALTLVSTSVTTSGTVGAGQRSVSFITSSDFIGSINGVTRQAGTVYSFSCNPANTLPAISYVITAGSIIIDKL